MRYLYKSFCASVLFLLAASAPAQGNAAGSGEAAGTFGYAHVNGITSYNHFTFGGSGSYNLNQVAAVGFEYRYTPLGSETIGGLTGSGHLQTYGGIARISFSQSPRFVPFALVGGGGAGLRSVESAEGASISASQNGYYFVFGGGVSLFTGPRWGVRPEFRYERQQFLATNILGSQFGAFGQNDIQAVVSVFYQFGGR